MAKQRKENLRGSTLATVDEQGRLKIPQMFKDILVKKYGYDFFVTSLTGEYVFVYPLTVWEAQIEERLTKTASLDPRRRKLLNVVNYFGLEVTMDKQGRISIPPTLRNSAAISGEVRVFGSIDHLDIWNEDRFATKMGDQQISDDDLSQLMSGS